MAKTVETPDEVLFKVWRKAKNVKDTDKLEGKTVIEWYRQAKESIPNYDFSTMEEINYNAVTHVCFHLLYKKFMNQLNKKQSGPKVVVITSTTDRKTVVEIESEKNTLQSVKIKRGTRIISEVGTMNIFKAEFLKYFAKGFFPIGFLSKIFIFKSADDVQYGVSMKTVQGVKTLVFSRKVQAGYDYVAPKVNLQAALQADARAQPTPALQLTAPLEGP